MQYEHIFFDLDCTLWDFETNSRETLMELITNYRLVEKGITSPQHFIEEYLIINERMWDEYRKELIDKNTLRYGRFYETFLKFGVSDKTLAKLFADNYISISPYKTNLFPYTIEVLEYLQQKYKLHIITNGFEKVQYLKLKHSGIEKYFSEIITSEQAGCQKPDIRIFNYSLNAAKAKISNSLMIGDNLEADIKGARNAKINQVYFNPKLVKHSEKITFEIKSLRQIFDIL